MNPRVHVLAGAIAALAIFHVESANACDVCAVYTATELREGRTGPSIGVAEQFTHFGTLRRGGDEVENPFDEKVDSSITQLLAGYSPIPDLTLQASLPIIRRSFRRAGEDGAVRGTESGVGDLTLLGQYTPWTSIGEDAIVRFTVFGGVKFPTGDSDRLGEELEEGHHAEGEAEGESHDEAEHEHAHEHELETGVHGHDLALGSGSYDGILGARAFASRGRAFFTGTVQWAVRSKGDFDYRYADDLTWSGGPGYFLWLDHGVTLGLQAILSGETKGKDEIDGERLDDTAITSLYAGPGLLFSWSWSLGAEIAGELPVMQKNTALQIVPDYRVRAAINWRF